MEFSPKPRQPGTKTTGLSDEDDNSDEQREVTKQRKVTYNLQQKKVVMVLATQSLAEDTEIEDKSDNKDDDDPDYKECGLNSNNEVEVVGRK